MRTDDGHADVDVSGPQMHEAMKAARDALAGHGWDVDQLILVVSGERGGEDERAVASLPEGRLGEALVLMGDAMGHWLESGGVGVEYRIVAARALLGGQP